MLSLVPRRTLANSGRIIASQHSTMMTWRGHSVLASDLTAMTTRRSNITHEAASSSDGRRDHPRRHWSSQDTTRNDQYATAIGNNSSTRRRFSSKYVSVDHSSAYRDAMASSHGVQLQLALEEGRGKDDAPFDPFSQFLDGMGSATVGFEDDDDIEEAEYKDLRSDDDGEDDEDDDDDDDDDDDREDGVGGVDPIYTTTGALYRPKSERLALRAGYPSGGKFAVIRLAGFQHKVTIDDLMVVNKLKPVSAWSVGSIHTVKDHDVMLIADQDRTLVGLPGVNGAEVDVMVEEITRDKTLVVFKKRRRKNSRRKNGFRRQVTFLRVLDVRMPTEITKISESKRVDLVDEDVRVAA